MATGWPRIRTQPSSERCVTSRPATAYPSRLDARDLGGLRPSDRPRHRRLAGAGFADQSYRLAFGTDRQADSSRARTMRPRVL